MTEEQRNIAVRSRVWEMRRYCFILSTLRNRIMSCLTGSIFFRDCQKQMELIIQKAVELGAYAIVPVETKRCVVKLDEKKAAKKTARWQQIAESAAKQSKRMLIPKIHEVMSFQDALKLAEELDIRLIPYELAKGMKETKKILNQIRPGQSVGIFIGPEGGFEENEVSQALEKGAQAITLGRRILRTETAGLAILSVLMFQLEND